MEEGDLNSRYVHILTNWRRVKIVYERYKFIVGVVRNPLELRRK